MKIRKLALAALPLAATIGTVATVASCKKPSDTVTMNYDQAKAWVKTNYGETSTFATPTKAVSSWDFSGEITYRKTMTEFDGYKGYIQNHLGSLFNRLGQMVYADAKATVKTTATSVQDLTYSAKTENDFEITSPAFTELNFIAPLCEANFDTFLNTYFYSVDAKRAVSFIASGKTLKLSGTMSSINDATDGSGCDIFAMPDCTLTFKDGKLISTEFSFKKYAEAEYFWLSYKQLNYTDFFHFTINEGGKISFKYTY